MVSGGKAAGEGLAKGAKGIVVDAAKAAFKSDKKKVGKDATRDAERRAARDATSRAGKDFTDEGRDKVYRENLERNGGKLKCDYCDKDVYRRPSQRGVRGKHDDAQIDHEYPKSRGGEGSPPNGRVACRRCNRDKSDKTLGEWDDELREWLE